MGAVAAAHASAWRPICHAAAFPTPRGARRLPCQAAASARPHTDAGVHALGKGRHSAGLGQTGVNQPVLHNVGEGGGGMIHNGGAAEGACDHMPAPEAAPCMHGTRCRAACVRAQCTVAGGGAQQWRPWLGHAIQDGFHPSPVATGTFIGHAILDAAGGGCKEEGQPRLLGPPIARGGRGCRAPALQVGAVVGKGRLPDGGAQAVPHLAARVNLRAG
jgi:hypothetical protein